MSYVEVVRVSKRFGGLTVLDEICLTIRSKISPSPDTIFIFTL
ncbi:hypothetical protein ACP3TJ_00020 [Desulforudis sp. 1088]